MTFGVASLPQIRDYQAISNHQRKITAIKANELKGKIWRFQRSNTTPSLSAEATTAWLTAAYLARAGKKVLVLERRHVLGGAAVTEEIFPGIQVLGLLLCGLAAAPGDHSRSRSSRATDWRFCRSTAPSLPCRTAITSGA